MRNNREAGFTLMEAVIALGLTSIMVVVLTQFFIGSSQIYRTQNSELSVNYTGRSALDEIDNYVRQASQVSGSYSAYTTGTTTLILEVQSINSTNQLLPGVYDTVVINLVGTSLYREIFPHATSARLGGSKLIGSNISNLEFLYNDNSVPLITTITTGMTVDDGGQVMTLSSLSHLRN